MTRSGADLALLLLGSYRQLVTTVEGELARRGFPDVRPAHEFAIRAIEAGADSASDLGRRMAVTKQAAGKMIGSLQQRGYVAAAPDPDDARRKRLTVTPHGHDLMHQGEAIFDELRADLEHRLGTKGLATLEEQLRTIVGGSPVRVDTPGWVSTTT